MAGLNPEPTVEVLYSAGAELGECPVYEEETGTLIWVDVDKKTINFLDPIAKTNKEVKFFCKVSAAIPVEGSPEQLVVLALEAKQICTIDRNTGTVIEVLAEVEKDKPQNKFNDAKCDSSGRLWFGTRGNTTRPDKVDFGGGFYSYDDGVVTKFFDAALSNGIDWNVADDNLYQVDTYALKLYSYDYNKTTGKITNQEPFIDFSTYAYSQTSFADGICTDTEGRLYVAIFNGQSITCWDPKTRELLLTIKFPKAKRITSCCFGGPNYEWLFVTSAKLLATEEELAECTNSGAVFVIKDLGVRGNPSNKFKPKK